MWSATAGCRPTRWASWCCIFAAASPALAALDHICTALQLVEHWQDVAEDLRQDRICLPRQDMEQFGVTEQDLAAAVTDRGFAR